MKHLPLIILAVALGACATQPATRTAFVSHTASGAFGSKLVDTTVNRNYEQVVSDLKRKFDECMNYSRIGAEHTGAGYKRTTSYYWATVKSVSSNKTEITFRTNATPGPPSSPDDGAIRAATDVHRIEKGKTKVVTYTTSLFGQGAIADTVKEWSEGRSASCPQVR